MRGVAYDPVFRAKVMGMHDEGVSLSALSTEFGVARQVLSRWWQQYSLQCARCHGEDAQGSSFGPSLLEALGPEGAVPTREEFLKVLAGERSDKGMPSAEKMGIDSVYFTGLYDYLKGRSERRYHGGRPARRE